MSFNVLSARDWAFIAIAAAFTILVLGIGCHAGRDTPKHRQPPN